MKYLRAEECKGKGILQPGKMNCGISPSTLGERGRAAPLQRRPIPALSAGKRLLTEFQAGKKKPLLQGREEKEFHEFCTCTRELWELWEGESSVVLPSAQGWQHPLALLMDVPAHQAPRKEKFRDEKLPHSRRTLPSPAPLHPEEPPLSLVYSKRHR